MNDEELGILHRHGQQRDDWDTGVIPWASPGRPPWDPETRPSGRLKWLAVAGLIAVGGVMTALGMLGIAF